MVELKSYEKIENILNERKWTRQELAVRSGLSVGYINKVTDGKKELKDITGVDSLIKLSKCLGVSVDYLLGLSDFNQPSLEDSI